jgi:hypothetical protein
MLPPAFASRLFKRSRAGGVRGPRYRDLTHINEPLALADIVASAKSREDDAS